MLDNLKKYFKQEEKVDMTTETNQAEMSVITAELSELKATFAQVSEALATAQAEKEGVVAQLEAANAALAAIAAEKEAVEAAVKQAKMDARMSKLVETVGDAKAAALMAATGEMEDAAFDAVVAALSVNMDKEANSEMFQETGVDAKAKPQEEEKPVDFKQFIKKA